jgi:hypothetical protein
VSFLAKTKNADAQNGAKSVNVTDLTVGLAIDICRSDGRMHSAVVAKVRPEQNLVDVEWFENVSQHVSFTLHSCV